MIAPASNILILILDLPEQLFLIDKTKKENHKQNIFCQKKNTLISIFLTVACIFIFDSSY